MHEYTIANVVLQIFCALMLGIILVSLMVSADRGKQPSRIFMLVTSMILVALLADAVAWGFDMRPGAVYRTLTVISNFLLYCLGMVSTAFLILYIIRSVPLKKRTERQVMGVTWSIVAAFHILLIASQFTGWVYYIDGDNVFYWGPLYWTAYLAIFLIYAVIIFVVFRHRRRLGVQHTLSFMAYVALPVIAVVVNVFIVNLMLLHAAGALALLVIFVNIHMQREKLVKDQELELQNQRIAVMLSQIRPHFLYNTMTSIANLCDKNPSDAKRAVISFSGYLRGNMDSLTESGLITFEKEFAHIEAYLDLEKAIYGKALNIIYAIEESVFMLPPLTVQPIVENAVKHGIGRRVGGGTVTIATKETGGAYIITVTDDGMGFGDTATGTRQGVGIENVRRRLAEQCGGTLEIASKQGVGTTATIEIPVGAT